MTDKYLSYIFFTCYIPLKHKYESYDIKWDFNLSLDLKKNSLKSRISHNHSQGEVEIIWEIILECRVSNV